LFCCPFQEPVNPNPVEPTIITYPNSLSILPFNPLNLPTLPEPCPERTAYYTGTALSVKTLCMLFVPVAQMFEYFRIGFGGFSCSGGVVIFSANNVMFFILILLLLTG
jgi:hypothetical protein